MVSIVSLLRASISLVLFASVCSGSDSFGQSYVLGDREAVLRSIRSEKSAAMRVSLAERAARNVAKDLADVVLNPETHARRFRNVEELNDLIEADRLYLVELQQAASKWFTTGLKLQGVVVIPGLLAMSAYYGDPVFQAVSHPAGLALVMSVFPACALIDRVYDRIGIRKSYWNMLKMKLPVLPRLGRERWLYEQIQANYSPYFCEQSLLPKR